MSKWFTIKYHFGPLKIKFGRATNKLFELLIYAHDGDEAEKLARNQINYRHGGSKDPEIISVEPSPDNDFSNTLDK